MQVLAVPAVVFEPVGAVSFCLAAPPHGLVLVASPPGGVFGGPGVVANRFNPADVGPGHYSLTYTWDFPANPTIHCPVVVTQTVAVTLVPAPRLPADTVLCFANNQPFQLRALPTGGTWSGAGVSASGLFVPPTAPGTTVLSYTLPGGCEPTPYRVTIPAATSTLARWAGAACPDNLRVPRVLRFEATGSQATQVQWDFGDGSAPATGRVVEHAYAATGRYQPLATLPGPSAPAATCANQLALPAVDVQAARLPNVITPNGDGQNDTFAPEAGGCPGRLRVFARWGQQVFEAPDYHNDWAAEGLPGGLYYYVLEGATPAARVKGWVEVVR